MKMRLIACLSAGLFSLAPMSAKSETIETHGAHEHGVAELTLAQSKSQLLLTLHSPVFNLFGFGHPPGTAQEKTLVESVLQQLEKGASADGKALIAFNPEAQCKLEQAALENPFHHPEAAKETEHEHEHEHAHENEEEHDHHHHGHADIDIEYTFTCQHAKALSGMNLQGLFTSWSHLEKVRAQWVVERHQSSATVLRQSPQVSFE